MPPSGAVVQFCFGNRSRLVLPDGKAFFLGGTGTNVIYTPSGNTNMGTWAQAADIPSPYCAWDNPAAMMVNGKILCVFGCGILPDGLYEYDPVADTFTSVGTWDRSGVTHTLLDLPDGTVLLSDGSSASLHLYSPDGTPLASGKPTISSITQNGDGLYHLTGTLLNGISQGASFRR